MKHPRIEREGRRFADADPAEIWVRGIEEEVPLRGDYGARQGKSGGTPFLHPLIANGGRAWTGR
jgi:hypothetical protein